jgi:hypothetical protein
MNERLLPHPLSYRPDLAPRCYEDGAPVPPLGPPLQPNAADSEAAPLDVLDALAEAERTRARRQEAFTFGSPEEHARKVAAHDRAVRALGFWHPAD